MTAGDLSPPHAALLPADLLGDLRKMIEDARQRAAVAVNRELTLLYWHVGRRIRQDILGEERADYGERIVATLSRQLMAEYGHGYEHKSLLRMMQFAEVFPDEAIVATLSQQLSWSHFKEIIPFDDRLLPGLEGRRVEVETARKGQPARVLLDGIPAPAGTKKAEFFVPRLDGRVAVVQLAGHFLDPVPRVTVDGVPQVLAPPLQWYEWLIVGLPLPLVFGGGAIGGLIAGIAIAGSSALIAGSSALRRSRLPKGARRAVALAVSLPAYAVFVSIALWERVHVFHQPSLGAPAPGPAGPGRP